jgi:uncharacterized protein (TIGR02652 family)
MWNVTSSQQYPVFGPEIKCPHCHQLIPALILTDTYLCPRHGAFEVKADTKDLVHLQSERHWRLWDGEWYRQHTHPDGIRFEIHETLDKLYIQGYRATKVTIAHRYKNLISSYLEHNAIESDQHRLYGLAVEFSPSEQVEPRWEVVNFDMNKELGAPRGNPYRPF